MSNLLISMGMVAALLGSALRCVAAEEETLSAEDRQAIQANIQSYRDAWLRGDAAGVIATLARDAVLLPSGQQPLVGEQAIRAFWWPADGAAGKVLKLELAVEEIRGQAGVAYAWGRGSLSYSYKDGGQERSFAAESTFLNVLRKGADGKWRTSCRMWSDLSRR